MGKPLTDLERRIDAVYDHFPKLTNATVRAVCVFARDMLRDDEDDHRPDSMVGLAELYIEQAKRLAVMEARLHVDCAGCPGCATGDCPDALDRAEARVAVLERVREAMAGIVEWDGDSFIETSPQDNPRPEYRCSFCDRGPVAHEDGCPMPEAYAALRAADEAQEAADA